MFSTKHQLKVHLSTRRKFLKVSTTRHERAALFKLQVSHPFLILYNTNYSTFVESNFHLFLDGTDEKAKPENPDTLELKSPEPNFIDELKARTARSFEKDPIGVLSRFCEREGLEFKLSRVTSDDKEIVAYTFE